MRIPTRVHDYYIGNFSISNILQFYGMLAAVVVNTGALFFVTYLLDSNMDRIDSMFDYGGDTFDFIIVGAGPSGCVMANRLSQKHKVLLLEAGGSPSPFLYIPVLFFLNQNYDPFDWKHRTVPQDNASLGSNGNVTFWPAARGLGGGSLLNGMIFIRGFTQGFDSIANRTGNPLWRTQNVLEYYKNLEDYHGHFDDGSHGKGGGVSVRKAPTAPFVDNLHRAGAELGYPVADLNPAGPVTERFSPMDYHSKDGRRWDVFSAYVAPILHRSNLVVRKYSLVTKVLFEGSDNRAVGVEYERHGEKLIAKANKEVILSAGGLQSPKILLLSGIGPKKHLDEVEIAQRVELPVGTHLQDKYGALLGPFVVAERASFLKPRDITAKSFIDFVTTGDSVSFGSSRLEATYTVRSPIAKRNGNPNPDIFTYIVAHSPDKDFDKDLKHSLNLRQEVLDKYHKTVENQDAFFQLVTIPKPKGHGILKLKNKDPKTPLYLDPKYLQNKDDLAVLVEGAKFAVKLVEETKSMKEVNATMLSIPYPGCENIRFKSDEYYECWVRHTTATTYKYCSTVPIGKSREDDPNAVVDPFLRVFGTKGLRVVDSSVIQEKEVSTNQVTCQMIASLVSDWIIDYWDNRSDESSL